LFQCIVISTNTYTIKVQKDVFHWRFLHLFYCFSYQIPIFCTVRLVLLFLIKSTILVHYSQFSIKVCLLHLNMNITSTLKRKLIRFINIYFTWCVYSNKMWYLQQFHYRLFSSHFFDCWDIFGQEQWFTTCPWLVLFRSLSLLFKYNVTNLHKKVKSSFFVPDRCEPIISIE
jgi:hypothetical protein